MSDIIYGRTFRKGKPKQLVEDNELSKNFATKIFLDTLCQNEKKSSKHTEIIEAICYHFYFFLTYLANFGD